MNATLPQPESEHLRCEGIWKVFGHHESAMRRFLAQPASPAREHPDDVTAAVKNVSFTVKPAETLVIMGLSGSGKSTLIRCITRLIEPTAGRVFFNDQCVTDMKPVQLREFHRHECAMVFQHFGLFPHRRVLDNVAFGLEVRGIARSIREDRARKMLDVVGLGHCAARFPGELSGGMKQRVGLARALAVEPNLLLFDEPFSALDPLIRRDLQDELLRLRRSVHKTMLFITHDMQEALKLGDRIAIMREGEVVQIGTPEEIVLQPADDYVQRFVSDTPRTHVLKAGTLAQRTLALEKSRTPAEALSQLDGSTQHEAVVLDQGRPLGAVSARALRAAVEQGAETIADWAHEVPQVSDGDDLGRVTQILAAGEHSTVTVVDGRGSFVGTVSAPGVIGALVGVTS